MYRFDLLSRRNLGRLPFVLSGEWLKKSAINYRKSFHCLTGVIALVTQRICDMPVPKFQRACNFQLQGCVIKTLNHKYHARIEGMWLTLIPIRVSAQLDFEQLYIGMCEGIRPPLNVIRRRR